MCVDFEKDEQRTQRDKWGTLAIDYKNCSDMKAEA